MQNLWRILRVEIDVKIVTKGREGKGREGKKGREGEKGRDKLGYYIKLTQNIRFPWYYVCTIISHSSKLICQCLFGFKSSIHIDLKYIYF